MPTVRRPAEPHPGLHRWGWTPSPVPNRLREVLLLAVCMKPGNLL